jgi:hypothetical protein
MDLDAFIGWWSAAQLDSLSGAASGAARFAVGGGCSDDGTAAAARDDLGAPEIFAQP